MKKCLYKKFFVYKRYSFLETTSNKMKQSINVHKTERDGGETDCIFQFCLV